MALLALAPNFLRLNQRLPFGVYDGNGQLLLAAGQSLTDPHRLQALQSRTLYADSIEAAPWRDSLTNSAHALIGKNATLEQIAIAPMRQGRSTSADTRPADQLSSTAPAPDGVVNARTVIQQASAPKMPAGTLSQQASTLIASLASALRDAGVDPYWLARVRQTLALADEFAATHPQAIQFLLFQHAAHSVEQYSTHHGLLCANICERVGRLLGWPAEELLSLTRAAATMNVAMVQLQDMLAQQSGALRPEQRARIEHHAEHGALLLAEAGVTDALWIEVVRLHDDPMLAERAIASLAPAQRLARLLRLVDRFTAKVSRRGNRQPLSPLVAARDACVGTDGRPDEFGSALLKSVGMYPPGSYVKLSSGEIGVVVSSGARANQPLVAVFSGASGLPLTDPVLRDTAQRNREVAAAVPVTEIRVRIDPNRVLALI
ncbi:MAG: HD-GYP domain-containing protein [Leptothrix sp. (in: b-proteobacteria)]